MGAEALRQSEIVSQQFETYDDTVTQFSELVDGGMYTSFELRFDGQELYDRDGRAVGLMMDRSIREAEAIAKMNPALWFEVRRRKLEKQEYFLMLAMARGEGPNTIIITSDFPAELMGATADVGGYNVTRKQTMQRVIARKPGGNIQLYSGSFDGSNRQALEATYDYFDEKPEEGELLGQRIPRDLSEDEQAVLIHTLRGIYDRSLAAQYGGEWYAGRRPVDYRNTYDFVSQQHDLLGIWSELKQTGRLTRSLMYDLAATMQKRFEEQKQGVVSIMPRIESINPEMVYREIELAGTQSRALGKSYSACGDTFKPEHIKGSVEGDMADAGYGNRTSNAETTRACEYTHENCYCCAFNDDGTSRSSKLKVRARRDANGTARCLRTGCGAWLSADGKNGDIGNIARKAARLKNQSKPKDS